jgi:hypothetical protein
MLPVGALAPIIFLVVRLVVRASRASQGKAAPLVLPDPRRLFWGVVAVGGLLVALPLGVALLGAVIDHPSLGSAASLGLLVAAVAGGVLAFGWTWSLLHSLARRGRHRLVYYLAQLSPLFVSSDNTRGGALLLSAMALAYRPSCTRIERAFVARRLAEERRGGAAFGAALAVWHSLEARAARDAGDATHAFELDERAWSLFGTITYMSDKATPLPVRRAAEEYLALDSARRAQWGGIEAASASFHARTSTPARQAMVAYVNEKLKGRERRQDDTRLLARLASPVVDRLFAREARERKPDPAVVRAWATSTYVTLLHRKPVSARAAVGMLAIYDAMLDPGSPDTLLPPEIREDEALVTSVHDEVADSLAEVLAPVGVPLAALARFGPISARVYARLETHLLQDLARSLKHLDERYRTGARLDARSEWLDTSLVRARYRRVQYTLGDAAATRVLQGLAFSYGNLGVSMTSRAPLRRPLSHAIFNVLHGEAQRCGHQASITLQARNMKITEGVR